LDPSQTESAALFVGDLISKLIKKGGDIVSPILPQLLDAVTRRLAEAKLPTFIQVTFSPCTLSTRLLWIPIINSFLAITPLCDISHW
jgi:hypothetical protein